MNETLLQVNTPPGKDGMRWWIVGLLVLIGILFGIIAALVISGRAPDPVRTDGEPPPAVVEPSPAELATECHKQTAHPADQNRFAAGLADSEVAPGTAIPACERAVQANPGNSTLLFELGRALWLGGRDAEAVNRFAEAAEHGHGGAMKYLGDAYLEGRGLPPGVEASIQAASNWYGKSAAAGFADGAVAQKETEDQIRRNRFDPTLFQNGRFMQILYDGNFAQSEAPIALAYYAGGIVKGLDSTESVYLDQNCKAMIGKLGSQLVDGAQIVAFFRQFERAPNNGEELVDALLKAGAQKLSEPYMRDQGERDATVLFNKDVLGCDSEVTKRIVANIMLTSQNNRAF